MNISGVSFFSYITPRVHLFSHLIILICLLRCSSVHHYTRFSINTVSVCRNQARNYMYNEWTPPNSALLSHYTIQFFLYRSFLVFSKYTITYVLMREWGVGGADLIPEMLIKLKNSNP